MCEEKKINITKINEIKRNRKYRISVERDMHARLPITSFHSINSMARPHPAVWTQY